MARLALALAVALAACSGSERQSCPGATVAVFRFTGTRVPAGDPALAGLDPNPAALDCEPTVGYPPLDVAPELRRLPEFDATLSVDPNSAAAALCKSGGVVLFGQRSGTHYAVELGTNGAVLGSCAATCAATMGLTVAGDVATSPEGEPTGFAGALVETMNAVAADTCGACDLPCEARYVLSGAP